MTDKEKLKACPSGVTLADFPDEIFMHSNGDCTYTQVPDEFHNVRYTRPTAEALGDEKLSDALEWFEHNDDLHKAAPNEILDTIRAALSPSPQVTEGNYTGGYGSIPNDPNGDDPEGTAHITAQQVMTAIREDGDISGTIWLSAFVQQEARQMQPGQAADDIEDAIKIIWDRGLDNADGRDCAIIKLIKAALSQPSPICGEKTEDIEVVKAMSRIISAEAAKAYADQQWREISLAPRDGVILVTNGNGTWPVTYRGGHDGDGYYEYSDAFPYGNTIKGLTHWQPLPPAPVSEGE